MENFDLNAVWNFTATHLTQTVNQIPNAYGYINELGYAPGEGVDSTIVEVALTSSGVRVLSHVERGGPSATKEGPAEKSEFLRIPSFPQTTLITPQDVQNWIKKANRQVSPVTMEQSLADRLENMRWDHDMTLEYIRLGSAKGQLLDGGGSLLLDLYDAFDVTQKVIDFDLSNDTADVAGKCNELFAWMRANLLGEVMSGIDVFCDKTFFDALITHPNVEKFFLGWEAARLLAGQGTRSAYGRIFEFNNIIFREYDGQVNLMDGSTVPLVAAGLGHAVPVGTRDAWQTYFGPPDDIRFANSGGLEIYMSQEMMKHGKGVELKSESCPLAVFRRPVLCVKLEA